MSKIAHITAAAATVPPRNLRDEFRAELEAAGLNISQAAREIGRSPGTISRWLAESYGGDNEAVDALVARWLETRAERAKRSLDGARLDRHAETGATAEIATALGYAQAAADVVMIHGPSGRGKTWAAMRHCAKRTGAYYLAVTGATGSMPGMLSQVAEAIGAGPRHGSALEAETTIVTRLRDRGALLVIDEAHHLRPKLLDELRCIQRPRRLRPRADRRRFDLHSARPLPASARPHRYEGRPAHPGRNRRGGDRRRPARAPAHRERAQDTPRHRARPRRLARAAPAPDPRLYGRAGRRAHADRGRRYRHRRRRQHCR